jgi:uncharacterized protein (DUF433 family)
MKCLRHQFLPHARLDREAVSGRGGAPCIRGLRIPVATVVEMVADGMTTPEILDAFPDLENEDVKEALRFAADAVRERKLPLAAER